MADSAQLTEWLRHGIPPEDLRALVAERDALKRELLEARAGWDGWQENALKAEAERDAAVAEKEAAVLALEDATAVLEHAGKWGPQHPNYLSDAAKRARAALVGLNPSGLSEEGDRMGVVAHPSSLNPSGEATGGAQTCTSYPGVAAASRMSGPSGEGQTSGGTA